MHPIEYMPAAERYFRKLQDRQLKEKFRKAIEIIRENPYSGQLKTGDLAGIFCYDVYHNRTNYEIAYRLSVNKDAGIIIVIMAGTRENFYKELKRYFS